MIRNLGDTGRYRYPTEPIHLTSAISIISTMCPLKQVNHSIDFISHCAHPVVRDWDGPVGYLALY
jgi:hypothetical protein